MLEEQAAANEPPVRPSPIWSVMIPTYRPNHYLRAALGSALDALRQVDDPAQIEVVDDASPDVDVSGLLQSWGYADKVSVFRRQSNGGLGNCWNTCVARASGNFVHILHQDDLVRPTFYQRIKSAAASNPSAGMVFCRTEFLESSGVRLDELEQPVEGLISDWLSKICMGQRLQCPSVVMRREIYEQVGGFDVDLKYVIDWVMWVKVAAFSDVAYIPDALAVYRIHDEAETKKIKAAGITTRDLARGLGAIRKILTDAERTDCLRGAGAYAIRASGFAVYEAETSGELRTAAKEIATSLRYLGEFMSPMQVWTYLKSYLRLRVKALV